MSWCLIYFCFFWLNVISVLAQWGAATSYLCSPAQRLKPLVLGRRLLLPGMCCRVLTLWVQRRRQCIEKAAPEHYLCFFKNLSIFTSCYRRFPWICPFHAPACLGCAVLWHFLALESCPASAVSAVCAGLGVWLHSSTEIWASEYFLTWFCVFVLKHPELVLEPVSLIPSPSLDRKLVTLFSHRHRWWRRCWRHWASCSSSALLCEVSSHPEGQKMLNCRISEGLSSPHPRASEWCSRFLS